MNFEELLNDPEQISSYGIDELEQIISYFSKLPRSPENRAITIAATNQIRVKRMSLSGEVGCGSPAIQDRIQLSAQALERLEVILKRQLVGDQFTGAKIELEEVFSGLNEISGFIRNNTHCKLLKQRLS